jgi:hypothetical protein
MAAGSRCQNVGSRVGCGTEQGEITLSISLVKIGNRDADEPNAHGLASTAKEPVGNRGNQGKPTTQPKAEFGSCCNCPSAWSFFHFASRVRRKVKARLNPFGVICCKRE